MRERLPVTTSSDIKAYFSSVPINRFLGFELEVCDRERCFLTMPVREDFRQEGGVVQGGIVAAFADTASAYALVPGLFTYLFGKRKASPAVRGQ